MSEYDFMNGTMAKLANMRTMLSHVRTAVLIMSLGMGVGRTGGAVAKVITAMSIFIAALIFAFGSYQYTINKKILRVLKMHVFEQEF